MDLNNLPLCSCRYRTKTLGERQWERERGGEHDNMICCICKRALEEKEEEIGTRERERERLGEHNYIICCICKYNMLLM